MANCPKCKALFEALKTSVELLKHIEKHIMEGTISTEGQFVDESVAEIQEIIDNHI